MSKVNFVLRRELLTLILEVLLRLTKREVVVLNLLSLLVTFVKRSNL